ncbi:hypothetical protein Tco_1368440 [Tanacetum coccineum]
MGTPTQVCVWSCPNFSAPAGRPFSTLIGGDPRKNDTVDMKEAQGNKAYTLGVLTKEAQPVTITDCHAGNPCELEIDLTAKSSSPIIEGMYGQDWKERAET